MDAGLSGHVGATFVQSVSHDLRAPLATIQMAATFLREQQVDAEMRTAMLRDIESMAERLRHLVTDLLDLSRLDAGILRPRRERVPVDELVYGALEATSLGA